jgi:hypothetical protein
MAYGLELRCSAKPHHLSLPYPRRPLQRWLDNQRARRLSGGDLSRDIARTAYSWASFRKDLLSRPRSAWRHCQGMSPRPILPEPPRCAYAPGAHGGCMYHGRCTPRRTQFPVQQHMPGSRRIHDLLPAGSPGKRGPPARNGGHFEAPRSRNPWGPIPRGHSPQEAERTLQRAPSAFHCQQRSFHTRSHKHRFAA